MSLQANHSLIASCVSFIAAVAEAIRLSRPFQRSYVLRFRVSDASILLADEFVVAAPSYKNSLVQSTHYE
jgi:hypothetical protein